MTTHAPPERLACEMERLEAKWSWSCDPFRICVEIFLCAGETEDGIKMLTRPPFSAAAADPLDAVANSARGVAWSMRREARRAQRRETGAALTTNLAQRIDKERALASLAMRRMACAAVECQRRVRGNRARLVLHCSAALVPLQALVRGVLVRSVCGPRYRSAFLDQLLFRVDTRSALQRHFRRQRAEQRADVRRLAGLNLGEEFVERAMRRAKPFVEVETALGVAPAPLGARRSAAVCTSTAATRTALVGGKRMDGQPQSTATLCGFYSVGADQQECCPLVPLPRFLPQTANPLPTVVRSPQSARKGRAKKEPAWIADSVYARSSRQSGR